MHEFVSVYVCLRVAHVRAWETNIPVNFGMLFNQCPKAYSFLSCCTGEDVDKVGGAGADNNFMTLSDSSTCGKMTALAKLLDLWYQQETANKV